MDVICHQLKPALTALQSGYQPETLVVGLSGGIDSVVLLHALVTLRQHSDADIKALQAVYVNHGISANAMQWQTFCQHYCEQLDVPFYARPVNVLAGPRESLEAVARNARYNVLLTQAQQSGGALLTAHHQDDQLETVLLQLKRGAGPKGLSGMASISETGGIAIARPMLGVSRQQIEDYARAHGLSWVDDESNADVQYDRNFLRHAILPLLTERWPAMAQTVSRSAALCGEQQLLMDEVCDERLASMTCASNERISVTALKQVSPHWQRALIRRWLAQHNLLMPSAKQLEQLTSMLCANPDSQPLVKLKAGEIRRFKDELYYLHNVSEAVTLMPQAIAPETDLQLDAQGIILRLDVGLQGEQSGHTGSAPTGTPLTLVSQDKDINTVATPALSIKVKPTGKAHHKPLKQWLKEWHIPPWERGKILLVASKNEPVALIVNGNVLALDNHGDVPGILSVRHNNHNNAN
ncbi:tRNA lysidine(34) synthetase TilS [Alteromonas gilva]|uniref:tRNA(Ile)-lysidine synthase n=1 Tax=Alteromonas gilva TaxID=2987522 RepID=A0ABT5L066_9ALTE|nr:tRNA lysidine(34) synthetase TilS [Alteromonas gilva]MDC8830419.1 tRNA lysidine(34) synthetase TilS [Alteromonas gilva]